MKTRQGFVSNSSSSSFVVLGSKMKEKDLKKREWLWDDDGNEGENLPKGIEVYYTEDTDGYVVGMPLCSSEDWGLENGEITFEELEKKRKSLTELGIPNVRLLMGTRPT